LSYRFDFGDGTVVGPQTGATAAHTYTAAGSYQATVTATDSGGLSSTATVTVVARSHATSVSYVSQIATNYSLSPHTSASVTVWRSGGVGAGHLMIVTVALTGTTAGTVTGTDDAHDTLTVASDITDAAGHRLIVLSGVAQQGLAPNQRITVGFPAAATYRLTADEASGVTGEDQHAEAAGTAANYSSGTTAATSSPNELVFGAVGLFAGSAPTWSAGWSALASYPTNADYLGRAYQITAAAGTFAASGTTSGSWLASTVTFA
jgi:PKD repeat protein